MSQTLIDGLRERVGCDHVRDRDADKAACLTDWRKRHRGNALCLVLPHNASEVAAVLQYCQTQQLQVFPQGGNTSVCGGSVPAESGRNIVLSLARMNRILDLNPRDHSMTVQAGCVLADLQRAAASVGRLLPLSLGAEGSCQIGGNIATNAGGTNVVRYGNTRDLVLGLEVVLPDGRIWDGLRTLRKNNSGYDLKNLFIGAEGTLGIVTAAALKLFPAPASTTTALLGFASLQTAVDEGIRLQELFPGELVGLELISRSEFEISLRHGTHLRNPFTDAIPAWLVLLELTSPDPGPGLQQRLEAVLAAGCETGVFTDVVIATTGQQRHDLWSIRHHVTEANGHEGMGLTHDIAVPVWRIPEFIARAETLLNARYPQAVPVVVGHMGDGNLHYIAMFGHGYWRHQVADPAGLQRQLSHDLYDIAAELGGTFSAEHGIGALHVPEMRKYKNAVELDLMRQIKSLLDPGNLLNPGRVVPP